MNEEAVLSDQPGGDATFTVRSNLKTGGSDVWLTAADVNVKHTLSCFFSLRSVPVQGTAKRQSFIGTLKMSQIKGVS